MLVNPDHISERLRAGDVHLKGRQAVIERLFNDAGCHTVLQPIDKKSANVICDLPGKLSDTIAVGGHLDFVEAGHGIVDDWSGTSLLVSLYQTLKSAQPKHSFEFIAFAGEERGLLGSHRYVSELKSGERPIPKAFINLECLGLAPPKVWATRSTPLLVSPLVEISNALHIPLQAVNVDRVGDDDTHPFLLKKIPVISIHSITVETFRILHTRRDNIDAINPADYYDAYRLVAFYLGYLDTRLASDIAPAGSY